MSIRDLFKKNDRQPTCSAVIVAAGSAKRMGEDKLMMQLGCMPVLARTLLLFKIAHLLTR